MVGLQVPGPDVALFVCGDELAAVGGEAGIFQHGWMFQGWCQRLTGERVPHTRYPIGRRRGDPKSIRAEGYAVHMVIMVQRRTSRIAGDDVPHNGGEILAAGDDPSPVTAEARAQYAIPVDERTADRIPRQGIPDAGLASTQLLVLAGGNDAASIGTELRKADR